MYIKVWIFYFYFQQGDPALCSGVGVDPFCYSRMLFIIVLTASFEPFLTWNCTIYKDSNKQKDQHRHYKRQSCQSEMLLHSVNSSPQSWPTPSAPLNRGRKSQVLDDWILWNVTCCRVNACCWGRIPVSSLALMFNKPPDRSGLAEATAEGKMPARSISLKK